MSFNPEIEYGEFLAEADRVIHEHFAAVFPSKPDGSSLYKVTDGASKLIVSTISSVYFRMVKDDRDYDVELRQRRTRDIARMIEIVARNKTNNFSDVRKVKIDRDTVKKAFSINNGRNGIKFDGIAF